MRRAALFLVAALALVTVLHFYATPAPTHATKASPIILDDNDVMVIEGTYTLTNDIVVTENATLIIRYATLSLDADHDITLKDAANGHPKLIVNNASVNADESHFLFVYSFDNSTVDVYNYSSFHAFIFAMNSTVVSIEDTYMVRGISAYKGVTVNVAGSTVAEITLIIEVGEVDLYNIKPGFFTSFTVNIDEQNTLVELTNTEVLVWYVHAFSGGGTVYNSKLGGISAYYNAALYLYDGSAGFAFAQGNGVLMLADAVVNGKVRLIGNSSLIVGENVTVGSVQMEDSSLIWFSAVSCLQEFNYTDWTIEGADNCRVYVNLVPPYEFILFISGDAPHFYVNVTETYPGPVPGDMKAVKSCVVINGTGTYTVELRIPYSSSDIQGIDVSTLKIYRWDGSSWVPCANSGVNTEKNYVYAILSSPHGYFAAMGEKSAAPPPGGVQPLLLLLPAIAAAVAGARRKARL